jgi:hypothetical protein
MNSLVWKTYKCSNAMSIQTDINSNMRAILADWLYEVCSDFKFPSHYIHRTFKFIDIYLEHKRVTKENLQKLGCACLAIVDLFFSGCVGDIGIWSDASDNAFSTFELMVMLNDVFIHLDYHVFIRTYYDVLKIKLSDAPEQIKRCALFIADYFLHIYNIAIEDEDDLSDDIIVLAFHINSDNNYSKRNIKCDSVSNALGILLNNDIENINKKILYINEKNSQLSKCFKNADYSEILKNTQQFTKKQSLLSFKTIKNKYICYNDIKIGKQIGNGAYGRIKLCEYNNEKFAIKQFFNDYPSSIVREIVISRSFNHPNILSFSDTTTYYSNINILMKLGNESLYKWIKSSEYSSHSALKFIDSLIIAITEFHSKGFIHRDIKPENIIVFDDDIKIADFGCSSHVDIYNEKKILSYEICTRWYRAPEVLLNIDYYNQKADVWALGCVIVEILHRNPILKGFTDRDQLHKIFKMFGTPHDCVVSNDYKFPHYENKYEIENILNNSSVKLSNKKKDILLSMFEYDPLKRPNMNEVFAFWFSKY